MAFSRRLYGDHLEEVDFLFAQRLGLFHDPEVEWPQIEDFENRLMAHIDGLILGGKAADELSGEFLDNDDIDTVRGGAFALAYSNSPDALGSVIDKMTQATPEIMPAYIDALKHPPNDGISTKLAELFAHERSDIRAAAADILGYRREGDPQQMANLLTDEDPNVIRAAAMAIVRMRYRDAVDQLRTLLRHPDDSVAVEAAFALASFDVHDGLRHLRDYCSGAREDYGAAPIYLALAGECADCDQIMQSEAHRTRAGIEALGIIGDPGCFEMLLDVLKTDDDLRLAAAESLELMTASGLTEEHPHVEEFEDPDEGVIETDETVLTRVSTSNDVWTAWLSGNRNRFAAGTRYRLGAPFSISSLTAEIAAPKSSFVRRLRAYHELLVRTPDAPVFEPDWFIGRQKRAIADFPS